LCGHLPYSNVQGYICSGNSKAFPVYKNGELICVGIYLTRMCRVIFVVVTVRH